ncbi:hypothetical protein RIR_jg12363.t1 [Rhizophagus irregularis DAOM 181602=DAOM 197198]|nr:hypothetical protein RIR_jg12363.t1 [Rhizophagus irregularis DAOM 181602=DAOM 197198]
MIHMKIKRIQISWCIVTNVREARIYHNKYFRRIYIELFTTNLSKKFKDIELCLLPTIYTPQELAILILQEY